MAAIDWPAAPAFALPGRAAAWAAVRRAAYRVRWPAALAVACAAGWETGRALALHLAWMVLS